jgi:hypothetical protein
MFLVFDGFRVCACRVRNSHPKKDRKRERNKQRNLRKTNGEREEERKTYGRKRGKDVKRKKET